MGDTVDADEPSDKRTYSDRGAEMVQALDWENIWPKDTDQGASAEFYELTQRVVFGQLYARHGLSLKDRELVVMALILAQGSERSIIAHFRQCHAVGITEREVREVIYSVCIYSGWPMGSQATAWFDGVLSEPDSTWPESMRIGSSSSP